MTSKQFRTALQQLGLSQVGAARILGIFSDRMARRYVAGDVKVPKAVAKILRMAVSGRLKIEEIRKA